MFKMFKVIVVLQSYIFMLKYEDPSGCYSQLAEVMAAYGLLNSDEGAGNFHSWWPVSWGMFPTMLFMEKILHHLGCIKRCK